MERLDHFMARANAAYYATRDPFADFTTAPEITQAFGEVLGAWLVVTWTGLGRPDPVLLAEAGPGRGTLMADALRVIRKLAPEFAAVLRLHLIETSPRLRAIQAQALPCATWHDGLDTLPPGPLLLLGNEFLDALPIRQFRRTAQGWAERHVENGGFVEISAEPPGTVEAPIGAMVEAGLAAQGFVAAVAARLVRDGGAALFIDYGPATSAPGDSLQALCRGAPADPLAAPGQADLTAHVDFQALAAAATRAGAAVHGPIPQGPFLARLGLFQRTDRLARSQPPARALALIEAAQRLAEPDRMGRLFQVMALCQPGAPLPAGFER